MDHRCNCGLRFPGSLLGAWQAKLHVEDEGHRLRPAREGTRALTVHP